MLIHFSGNQQSIISFFKIKNLIKNSKLILTAGRAIEKNKERKRRTLSGLSLWFCLHKCFKLIQEPILPDFKKVGPY